MVLFLRLADGDGKMTAREMERFDELIASRDWCHSSLLRRSLANTQAEKAELWKQYIAGAFHSGTDEVAASLDTVFGSIAAEEQRNVQRDLVYFCGELLKTARGNAGLFQRDREAEAAFVSLLDLLKRPSSRTAQKSQLQSAIEPKAKRYDSAELLAGEVSADIFWQRGKLALSCIQVIDETHDVKTFRFVADPPKLFRYHPGQFVTLEIPLNGEVVRRSYTISASPSRPHAIAVTVKRVEGGRVSNWIHDNVRVGTTIFADGPHGKFTCVGSDGGPYLFISGGSGITPVMAMCRWLCDTMPESDIQFLHFARTPVDLIFEHELRLMERQLRGFSCHFVCSGLGGCSDWTGRIGRISPEILTESVPDITARTIYLCGPVPFMQTTRDILAKLGIDMARFRQESFGGVPRANKSAGKASAFAKIVFLASKVEADCMDSDYVLDLALARGLPAVFSCRAGQCGTCKVALLEGSVEHDCADGLTPEEAKEGIILPCQARPMGRVVVDL